MSHFQKSGSMPTPDDGSGASDDSRGAGARRSHRQISFGVQHANPDPFQNRLRQQDQEAGYANLGLVSPKSDEEEQTLGEQMS